MQQWRIKTLSSCRGGVTRLELFSQLARRTITNKMADALSWWHHELWLAHSNKIALQVAEEMLHASNLSRNVEKSRGSFYFSCNSQRNNCSCKMGCYMWIFSCNLQQIASCNMALRQLYCYVNKGQAVWFGLAWLPAVCENMCFKNFAKGCVDAKLWEADIFFSIITFLLELR